MRGGTRCALGVGGPDVGVMGVVSHETIRAGLAEREGGPVAMGARRHRGGRSQHPERPRVLIRAALRERLAPFADTPWLTFHHPWGYFQQRLGLRAPVIISEQLGAGPSSRRFVALAQQLEAEQVHCAILEPEAQPDLVARLCPACQRVALDPLGRDVRPRGQGDDYSRWLSDRVAATFADCLAPSP